MGHIVALKAVHARVLSKRLSFTRSTGRRLRNSVLRDAGNLVLMTRAATRGFGRFQFSNCSCLTAMLPSFEIFMFAMNMNATVCMPLNVGRAACIVMETAPQ